jgi:transposase
VRRTILHIEHGMFLAHHRFMHTQLLSRLDHLEQQISQFTVRIEELLVPFVDEELQEKLDAVPGVDIATIQNVTAEIGVDLNQFPSAGHLASWAGICPGNEESAGKRKRSRTTKGNRWLWRALTQAAGRPRIPRTATLALSIIVLPVAEARNERWWSSRTRCW